MISVAEAQRLVLDLVQTTAEKESLPLLDATGRTLSQDIEAPFPLPRFDTSGMDGFAVYSGDLNRCSPNEPVELELSGETPAGAEPHGLLKTGCAVRVFTGSPLPQGANAVVMQEDCEIDEPNCRVRIHERARPWENVRLKGEDIDAGSVVLKRGEMVNPVSIGLFRSLGLQSLAVSKNPRVGLLSTGNELREPGEQMEPGSIFESNSHSLAALLRAQPFPYEIGEIVRDDLPSIKNVFSKAFEKNDFLLTTGGASVGRYDRVQEAFLELGGKVHFWKVSVKPGKPLIFGTLGPAFFFGLPGNPVSALVTFLLFVRPALLKFAGRSRPLPQRIAVRAGEKFENSESRTHYVRVRLNEAGCCVRSGLQASHILSGLAESMGVGEVPSGKIISPGETIEVIAWCPM